MQMQAPGQPVQAQEHQRAEEGVAPGPAQAGKRANGADEQLEGNLNIFY